MIVSKYMNCPYLFCTPFLTINSFSYTYIYLDAWFVCDDHAFLQLMVFVLLGTMYQRKPVGGSVYVSKISDAVTGTALEIQIQIPDRSSGQDVKIVSVASIEESCPGQTHHGADHCGEVFLHLLVNRAKDKGSGDVSGTLVVSATCII